MQHATPRQRVLAECSVRGQDAVVEGCVRLLAGGDVDRRLLEVLAGASVRWGLDGPDYWLRVWALRGLLWGYAPAASTAVIEALSDDAWRVREMACKVVARHGVGDAVPQLTALADDPVPRVRTAAARALARLTADGS